MKQPRDSKKNTLFVIIGIVMMAIVFIGCDTPFSNLQAQIDNLEGEVVRIDLELSELRDEITRIDGEIARIDTTIDNYVAQFVAEVGRLDDLIKTNTDTINDNYDDLQQQIEDALDTALTKLGEFEDDINNRVDNLETDVYGEITQLTTSINTLFAISIAQQVQISANAFQAFFWLPNVTIPNAIAGLRSELLPQITNNALGISANAAAIGLLNGRVGSLETSVSTLQTSLSAIEDRVDNLNIDAIAGLRSALNCLGNDIDVLRADMATAINNLRTELISYIDDEIAGVNANILALTGRVTANDVAIVGILSNIADLQNTISALEDAVADLDIDDIAGLRAALEGLGDDVDALETQLTQYIDDEVDAIIARIENLESAVGTGEDELNDLLEDYASLAAAIEYILGELGGNGGAPGGGGPFAAIAALQAKVDALEVRIEALEASFVTYEIGDFAHGGVVFYVDETGRHGLVAAIRDQGYSRWSPYLFRTGADSVEMYGGEQNTIKIIAEFTRRGLFSSYAAKLAADYEGGGFGDWYLPSKEELNQMFQNRFTITNTATANGGTYFHNITYWSSTEWEGNFGSAYSQNFSSGHTITHIDKRNTANVRAVRRF